MTRRNAITAGLVAAAVVVLLWSAWRIVQAQLTVGTAVVAWGLWLVLAMAVASAVAYLLELLQQRGTSRRVGWRPLPGVSLLWIAGLATMGVFGFLMPDVAGAHAASQSPVADSSTSTPTQSATSASLPTPTATASSTPSAHSAATTPASRSQARLVPAAARTTAVTPRPVSTTSAPSAPVSTSPTPTSTSSPTSTPLVSLPILHNGKPHPTK